MTLTTQNFFSQQPQKRMDVLNEDLPNATGERNPATDSDDDTVGNPSGADSSGDVKQADGVDSGNATVPFGGSAVSAPRVATATSKSAVVQHGAGASRVKP